MAWDVEFTDEFAVWWDTLTEAEQAAVTGHVEALAEHGQSLTFPRSSKIMGSKHGSMRELRVKGGKQIRVLYAFDTRRVALLIIGGDKTGQDRWYEVFVPMADRIFDAHLERVKRENPTTDDD